MSIYLGSNKINELYLGSKKIGSIYLGTQKVYSASLFDSVTIGSQTWMSKNLAINDGQGGIYTQTVNYGQGNVVEYYYNWNAAVRVAASIQGWHLPDTTEWDTLANTVGSTSVAGTKLKSSYGWNSGNGTDNYGFSALPAGYWNVNSFYSLGTESDFWTSKPYSSSAYRRYFDTGASMISGYRSKVNFAFSVRLVKDT